MRRYALGTALLAFSVGSATADDSTIIFAGHDPFWQAQTTIVKRDDVYFMDGEEMEELRHANMPADGLALAIRDRIGAPDNYFLLRDGRLEIYVNCEFGPCTKKRSFR